MPTNFLYNTGTNGFLTSPLTLMSTELGNGTGLASGAAALSSVGGTSGKFSQSSLGSGLWGYVFFTAGGAFTPVAGGHLACWFVTSDDGGTNFESNISTPSTSVPALARIPDFIIPFDNVAFASGNKKTANGEGGGIIRLPALTYKLLVQNNLGVALSASGHTISVGSIAEQY